MLNNYRKSRRGGRGHILCQITVEKSRGEGGGQGQSLEKVAHCFLIPGRAIQDCALYFYPFIENSQFVSN